LGGMRNSGAAGGYLMMIVVLIAGIGVLLAGLLAIAYGIPIKEFGFGNTLIVTGALGACTGVMMLVLWIIVRELKKGAAALGHAPREAGRGTTSDSGDQRASGGALTFSHDPDAGTADSAQPLPQGLGQSRPRQREPVSRDRSLEDMMAEPEAAPAPAQPRRNLLFSSSLRRDRERTEAQGAGPFMDDLHPAGAEAESAELPLMFERSRSADAPRRGRTPLGEARPGTARADRHPQGAQAGDQPPITILKSGVVDGMAYSLYSDGSIEAQMPEGMMRFASIDELRAHLDHRP
jgi:hypothetical protein